MSEGRIERKSLEDLKAVLKEAHNQSIKLVIMGGYAVAAYTRGYRSTKDIDLVADKPALGKLKGLLTSLGLNRPKYVSPPKISACPPSQA